MDRPSGFYERWTYISKNKAFRTRNISLDFGCLEAAFTPWNYAPKAPITAPMIKNTPSQWPESITVSVGLRMPKP